MGYRQQVSMLVLLVLLGLRSGLTYSADLSGLAQVKVNSTLLKILLDSEDNHNISDPCRTALKQLQNGIATSQDWAIRMVDASAAVPSGVLEGSLNFYGSYYECLNIPPLHASKSNGTFSAQYCPVTLKPVQTNISKQVLLKDIYRWDLCVPSACTTKDLETALLIISSSFAVSAEVSSCSVQSAKKFDTSEIISLVILSLLASLLLSGTLLDIINQIRDHFKTDEKREILDAVTKSKSQVFLEAFSLYTNACNLLDTSSGSDSLAAVNGIRVLSTIWVVIGHTYLFLGWSSMETFKQLESSRFRFLYQVVINFTVSVDTFFFMSGLLVVYSNLKKLSKSSSINWLQFYFHRYWRLTPPVAFLILFVILWPRMGSGLNWDEATSVFASCRTNCWTNFLYINNLNLVQNACLVHSWYLAADMQFYILSPLVFYPMWRWPAFGLVINGIFLLVSVVTPAILGVTHDLLPTSLPLAGSMGNLETIKEIYIMPYCRMGPYCIGMALGYVISLKTKVHLLPMVQMLLWITSFALTSSVLFGLYSWNTGHEHSPSLNAFYLSTHRSAWTLGLAWLTYACLNGYGGIVNRILSWKAFPILAKLSYTTYLIHIIVIQTFSGLLGDRLLFSHFIWVVITLGIITLSFGLAFITTLCVEVPFQRLDRLLWPSHQSFSAIVKATGCSQNQHGVFSEDIGHINKANNETN